MRQSLCRHIPDNKVLFCFPETLNHQERPTRMKLPSRIPLENFHGKIERLTESLNTLVL